ncbi:MAG: hypothetical protein AAGA77_12595 [Bacteroidota bacterium]
MKDKKQIAKPILDKNILRESVGLKSTAKNYGSLGRNYDSLGSSNFRNLRISKLKTSEDIFNSGLETSE